MHQKLLHSIQRLEKLVKSFMVLSVFASALIWTSTAGAFVYQERVAMSKALAHYAMGQIYDLLGVSNRAVLEYEAAAQFDDASYLTHLRLGADYARLDLLDDAVDELKLVHVYKPEDLQSHYLLALIYSTQQEYNKAAEEYEYILQSFSKAEPKNIEIYGYLGQLYYSQKKYDEAIEQFERILDLEPKNADIMYLLGSLYLEVRKKNQAIDILKESIKIDPDHDGSLNTLGYIYAEENIHLDEALSLVNRALKLSPNNGAYLDSLGWVYYKRGDYEESISILEEASMLLKDPVIYNHMGEVYYTMNRLDDALKSWEKSLQLQPNQDDIFQKINDAKNIQARKVDE